MGPAPARRAAIASGTAQGAPWCETVGALFAPAGFTWIVLPRHGKRPLRFAGRILVRAPWHAPGLPAPSAASVVALFERGDGGVAASVAHDGGSFGAAWRGAWACPDGQTLTATLRAHDPASALACVAATDALHISWRSFLSTIIV